MHGMCFMITRHGILPGIWVGVGETFSWKCRMTFGKPIRANDGIKTVSSTTQYGHDTKILMLSCRIARSWRMEMVETLDESCHEGWDREEARRWDLGSVMRFPRFCVYMSNRGVRGTKQSFGNHKALWTLVFSVSYLICLSSKCIMTFCTWNPWN
jgi:hypothetical protein